LLQAIQGGYQRTAEAFLNPEGAYSHYELAICKAIHAGDLTAAKTKTKLAEAEVTKLMARGAESDLACYKFGAALGKTEHIWLREYDCKALQTLPANPTAERLCQIGDSLQANFVQRLGVLLGGNTANLHMGPVKKVDSLARKLSLQGSSPEQMLDINRASLYTNGLEEFAFLGKLEAGEVPGLKCCRAKVGEEANKWPEDHNKLQIPPNLFLNLEMTSIPGTRTPPAARPRETER